MRKEGGTTQMPACKIGLAGRWLVSPVPHWREEALGHAKMESMGAVSSCCASPFVLFSHNTVAEISKSHLRRKWREKKEEVEVLTMLS